MNVKPVSTEISDYLLQFRHCQSHGTHGDSRAETYLQEQRAIVRAKVSQRTADAVIYYSGKAIPFIGRGLRSLFRGRVDVHVLDAVSVSFALINQDFDTASSVMFLLGVGDIMEDWTHQKSDQLKSSAAAKAYDLADKLVPVTFSASLLTLLLTQNPVRAYSILMVDFCCALKFSVPIAVLSAMREANEHLISVKNGKTMEAFANADTIVFDKTGTLTKATPKFRDIIPFDNNAPDEMLRLAACLEEHYPHSMANAVVQAARERDLRHEEKHSRVQYIVAHGIASEIDGMQVRIGSSHFIFEDEKAVIPEGEEEKFRNIPEQYSHLYLAIGGRLSAVILIEDPLKEDAMASIRELHRAGFKKVVMLTGDSERTACAESRMIQQKAVG